MDDQVLTTTTTIAEAASSRPSRYRSQRRVARVSDEVQHDVPVPSLPTDGDLGRTKSRYHRKPAGPPSPPNPPASETSAATATRAMPTAAMNAHGATRIAGRSNTRDQPNALPQFDAPRRYHSQSVQNSPRQPGYAGDRSHAPPPLPEPAIPRHAPAAAAPPRARTPTTPGNRDARVQSPDSTFSFERGDPTRTNSFDEPDSGVEFSGRRGRPSPPPLPAPPAFLNSQHRQKRTPEARSPPHATITSAIPTTPGRNTAAPVGELFPPPRPTAHMPAPGPGQGPPRSDQIRATKSLGELPRHRSRSGSNAATVAVAGLTNTLSMFKRRRPEDGIPPVPNLDKASISRPMPAKPDPPVAQPPSLQPSVGIIAGGGGAVPGTDAPVSAVNAGDRRVLIECGGFRNIFPVTPTTTSIDLIKSAATCMSEPIDVKSAVLLEYFSTVGVQRPLRRYEHVRDVMNSWDHDRQNSLLLIDPQTGTSELELSLAGVPSAKPEDCSWPMYFSQKPGKWERRFVTLKTDGQVTCQKEPEKPKDVQNVCHMSDFDIYTPTAEKARKKIKPPKKYCFAIKSQQKTSMFEETSDFVHFFSTSEKVLADSFYQAMQSWRSWYLVNVLGEGNKAAPVANPTPKNVAASRARSGTKTHPAIDNAVQAHRRNSSTASHYQLGSFMPLFDMTQFDKKPEAEAAPAPRAQAVLGGFSKSAAQFDVNVSPERRAAPATSRTRHPPVSMQNKALLRDDEPLANLARRGSVDRRKPSVDQNQRESSEFAVNGLLGRQYSLRQKENSERAAAQPQPFTAGPSLLNGGAGSSTGAEIRQAPLAGDGVRRHGSVRNSSTGGDRPRRSSSIREQQRGPSTDLQRTGSVRNRDAPKPLIDLTPQYREPPQHARKGKGFHPDTVGPGGLIDNATSPEDMIGVPASTDWRGRNRSGSSANAPPPPTGALAPLPPLADGTNPPQNATHDPSVLRTAPSHAHSRSRSMRRPTLSAGSRPVEPFTGEGLLAAAQAKQGWGDGRQGRGVMDGSHAGGRPMVELDADSTFVEGSLLNRVEREQGPSGGPVIDREKRVERVEKVGEGF